MDYTAFISYSHAADGELAPRLQQALHKFAKPWYRLRALRMFRDKTSLSLTPELWPTIQHALEKSENFILLASPEAAASPWVRQEVDYWIANRSSTSFFIVLTEGSLEWDRGGNDFHWEKTDALPPNLKGYFGNEPLYLDLRWARTAGHVSLRQPRMQDAVADLAAPLHGRPKDELVGADIREHRRALRLAWGAGIGLFLLTVLAGLAAYYANHQRLSAERFARHSLSRALSAQSVTNRVSKPETSLLLALEAVETTRTVDALVLPEAEESLRSALAYMGASMPLNGHSAGVWAADFSPDGKRIATSGEDGTVRVWHSDPGRPENFVLDVGPDGARSISFNTNGRMMLAVGGGVATVWGVAGPGGEAMFRSLPEDNVGFAAFMGEDALLALAREDGLLHLVGFGENSATARRSYTFEGSPEALSTTSSGDAVAIGTGSGQIYVLASRVEGAKLEMVYDMGAGSITVLCFSGNGRWLFAGDMDGRAVVIDRASVPQGAAVLSVRPEDVPGFQRPPGADPFGDVSAGVDMAAFDGAGRYVAAGIRDGSVRVWGLSDTATAPLEIKAHADTVLQVAFGPDSTWLMTSGRDGFTRFFSLPDGKLLYAAPHRHEAPVDVVALNPAGTRLLTADRSGKVRIWWLEPGGQEPMEIPGVPKLAPPAAVAFDARKERIAWTTLEPNALVLTRRRDGGSPSQLAGFERDATVAVSNDGRFLAANDMARVFLWDLEGTRAEPFELKGHTTMVFELAFSSDGMWLASGSGDTTALVWRVDSPGQNAVAKLSHGSTVGAMSFDAAGKFLATGDWSGVVRVWSVPDGAMLREEKPEAGDSVRRVLFTPDGRWLIASTGKIVWVCPLKSGSAPFVLRGHTDMVDHLVVDEGSQWLASGGWDGIVRLWRLADSGRTTSVLRGHVKSIVDLAFSPDGKRLATTEGNAMVLLWDVLSPEASPVRLGVSGAVAAVAFEPEGRNLIAMTQNGGMMLWDLDVERLVKLGCNLAGRTLSREEWAQFRPAQAYSPQCLGSGKGRAQERKAVFKGRP